MDYFDERDYLTEETVSTDGESEITDFFDGTSVLLTGVTGFIGHLILEKILRCCTGVKRVFIIVRMKKGKTAEERLRELLSNDLFLRLWKSNPDFVNKIVLIPGDCSHPQLDLSPESREKLMETNIIIHVAANLQFDDHFRKSFTTNVLGTRALLELAKQMKNFKAFTYVSTAYVDVEDKHLAEDFVKPEYRFKDMKQMIDYCTDDEITGLMPFLKGKATTYSFMKLIAEEVVAEYKDIIPVGIVRPSIVVNTSDEPIKGWINGLNGQAAIVLGCLLGLLRVVHLNKDHVFDLIPADKVSSAILATTWDFATNKPLKPVYNVVSWKKSPIDWNTMRGYYLYIGEKLGMGSKFALWKPFTYLTNSIILYNFLLYFLHVIPGILGDCILRIKHQKPRLLKLYRKAVYLGNVMYVYMGVEWYFKDDHLYSVWEKMNPTDKIKYNFSMENFDWKEYNYAYIRGVQIYTLKEKLDYDNLLRNRRRTFWLKVVHYTVCTIFWVLLLLLLKCFLI